MSLGLEEIERRKSAARAAINKVFGTPADKYGVTLFISHHLKELDSDYWKKHLGTETPDPQTVLELLEFKKHWDGPDEIDTFDFTLPEDVTNYVICVKFDEFGKVSEVAMES
jgi:hypothetical protein